MVFYDAVNNRLVYLNQKADSAFWDKHRQTHNLQNIIKAPPKNRFIIKTTRKYLQDGGRILEAGCGMGDKVYLFIKRVLMPMVLILRKTLFGQYVNADLKLR
ncbi:MAG: hypothetical protein ACUZ8O_08905 [Candidatus Anammoxibacter sp.]